MNENSFIKKIEYNQDFFKKLGVLLSEANPLIEKMLLNKNSNICNMIWKDILLENLKHFKVKIEFKENNLADLFFLANTSLSIQFFLGWYFHNDNKHLSISFNEDEIEEFIIKLSKAKYMSNEF